MDSTYGAVQTASGPELALGTLCFAFQIYLDFSAYSDIAIGVAGLFGFDLVRNFAYPYFSRSVGEFWRRWHMSLSTWFRDYVFIPMGGSRVGRIRLAINLMVTFLLSGLWHGASWTFVVWGGLNGIALCAETLWGRAPKRDPEDPPGGGSWMPSWSNLWRMAAVFTFICFSWVFFRARSTSEALLVLGRIGQDLVSGAGFHQLVARLEATPRSGALFAHLGVLLCSEWFRRTRAHPMEGAWSCRAIRWILYSALILDVLYMGTRAQGAFIYFQF